VSAIGKFTAIQSILVVKESKLPPRFEYQIIVGTPGSVLHLMTRRVLDISELKVLVLDEADLMLDNESLMNQSLRIKRATPANCQILLFSATFQEKVAQFAERFVKDPKIRVSLKPEELSLQKIKQFFISCKSDAHKISVLKELYGYIAVGSSMIFVGTKECAKQLYIDMTNSGHEVALLHGELQPNERDRVLDDFRDNKTRVLIATNVVARGIDILSVSLVINFDLPVTFTRSKETGDVHADPETYLHRIGRSGRFGRAGIAINLVHNPRSRQQLAEIEKYFARNIEELSVEMIPKLSEMLEHLN